MLVRGRQDLLHQLNLPCDLIRVFRVYFMRLQDILYFFLNLNILRITDNLIEFFAVDTGETFIQVALLSIVQGL